MNATSDNKILVILEGRTEAILSREMIAEIQRTVKSLDSVSSTAITLQDFRDAVEDATDQMKQMSVNYGEMEIKQVPIEAPFYNWRLYESSMPRNVSGKFFGGVMGWGWNTNFSEWLYVLKYWMPKLPDTKCRSVGRARPKPIRAGCPPMNRGRHYRLGVNDR